MTEFIEDIILTAILLTGSHLVMVGAASFAMWDNFFILPLGLWDGAARFFYGIVQIYLLCTCVSVFIKARGE